MHHHSHTSFKHGNFIQAYYVTWGLEISTHTSIAIHMGLEILLIRATKHMAGRRFR